MESINPAVTNKSVYLYCFFEGPAFIPPGMGANGNSGAFVLTERDICALAIEAPLCDFREDGLNERLRDLKWLTPRVLRHDELIKCVMKTRPVIPVKFGAIFNGGERVRELMRRGYDELHDFMDLIRDKEEWGVKVYFNENTCMKAVESSSDLIMEFDRQSSLANPGRAYFIKKKRDDLLLRETLCLQNSISDEIYRRIAPQCVDARKNKSLSKEATGKKEKMTLNAAFLLEKTEAEFFKQKIDNIAALYNPQGILIEISGPWPPYNFCPEFEVVREACAV